MFISATQPFLGTDSDDQRLDFLLLSPVHLDGVESGGQHGEVVSLQLCVVWAVRADGS